MNRWPYIQVCQMFVVSACTHLTRDDPTIDKATHLHNRIAEFASLIGELCGTPARSWNRINPQSHSQYHQYNCPYQMSPAHVIWAPLQHILMTLGCHHPHSSHPHWSRHHWPRLSGRHLHLRCPTQMRYWILWGTWPCVHKRQPSTWHKSFSSYNHVR